MKNKSAPHRAHCQGMRFLSRRPFLSCQALSPKMSSNKADHWVPPAAFFVWDFFIFNPFSGKSNLFTISQSAKNGSWLSNDRTVVCSKYKTFNEVLRLLLGYLGYTNNEDGFVDRHLNICPWFPVRVCSLFLETTVALKTIPIVVNCTVKFHTHKLTGGYSL